jgi:hypothetical protein
MPQVTTCLITTVKNTSGGSKHFAFLPPHGRTLANNAESSYNGELIPALRRNGSYVAGARAVTAFFAALEAGDMEIIKTPAPVFYDPTRDNTKILRVDNGVTLLADPCWLATSSSAAV